MNNYPNSYSGRHADVTCGAIDISILLRPKIFVILKY